MLARSNERSPEEMCKRAARGAWQRLLDERAAISTTQFASIWTRDHAAYRRRRRHPTSWDFSRRADSRIDLPGIERVASS